MSISTSIGHVLSNLTIQPGETPFLSFGLGRTGLGLGRGAPRRYRHAGPVAGGGGGSG